MKQFGGVAHREQLRAFLLAQKGRFDSVLRSRCCPDRSDPHPSDSDDCRTKGSLVRPFSSKVQACVNR